MNLPFLSVVIPAYNEAQNVPLLASTLQKTLDPLCSWELVFVNDGSRDGTLEALQALHANEARVRFVSFSRNFGKEAAIFAGLNEAIGDAVVVIDADLQHPPATISEMVRIWQQGNVDVVEGIKSSRGKESFLYRAAARVFNGLMYWGSSLPLEGASDFKLLDRRVVDVLKSLPESARFFRGLTEWVGFRHASVGFHVAPRVAGTTKWSTWGLVRYSVRNLVAFSAAPLRAISVLGGVVTVAAVILSAQTIVMKLLGNAVEGFTTVILAVSFFAGAILIALGIIGEYLAHIYEELKRRPPFIISDRDA